MAFAEFLRLLFAMEAISLPDESALNAAYIRLLCEAFAHETWNTCGSDKSKLETDDDVHGRAAYRPDETPPLHRAFGRMVVCGLHRLAWWRAECLTSTSIAVNSAARHAQVPAVRLPAAFPRNTAGHRKHPFEWLDMFVVEHKSFAALQVAVNTMNVHCPQGMCIFDPDVCAAHDTAVPTCLRTLQGQVACVVGPNASVATISTGEVDSPVVGAHDCQKMPLPAAAVAAGGPLAAFALALEDSVYFDAPHRRRHCQQIVLSGLTEANGTTVKWRLARL